jgi:hypothetical protein
MAALFLLAASLTLVVLRFHMPWVRPARGDIVRKINVPIRAKVRLQRPNVYAIAALMLLGGIGGWVPAVAQIAVVLAVSGIFILPLEYTVTTQEIAFGRTPARGWDEFTSVERQSVRLLLTPAEGARRFEVWLPSDADETAIEADLRRLVRGGAQGRTTLTALPGPSSSKDRPVGHKRAM